MDDESHWPRQLLIGVVLLLVVGAMIGGIVALAGIKVADLAGINDDKTPAHSNQRLHIPRNAHTPDSDPSTSGVPSTSGPPSTTATSKPPPHHPAGGLTLTITPKTAAKYAEISLSGTYKGHDGATLQVQRKEGGSWADFPTTTTVSGGQFAVHIETGHFGLNHFRMTDTSRGVSSNTAFVTIL
ncbi:MAG: hypothetical protein QOK15_3603 [Nocardioidaceae bacterium]|nr:hypothetical protein [Nocardioidaceae bacterium]